jgi:aconitate hydratase
LANACGPCIGQWKRDDIQMGEENSIVSSYNRNFPKRNDGNPQTCSFIGSPETTLAYALFGRLDLDPFNTDIEAEDGSIFRLKAPENIDEVPNDGFVKDEEGYQAPAPGPVAVVVADNSDRLETLTPFDKWNGEDYSGLRLLLKAQGKCTTDHISPAGPWLKFRGHLDNISDNMFNGAINAFSGEAGFGANPYSGEKEQFSKIARDIKSHGEGWIAVGDSNYAEGSSREHAAMSPRLLGCRAVITRSFARIHETNLKKQGVLPLTFVNEADYNLIEQGDIIDLVGLTNLNPGSHVKAIVRHTDGSSLEIDLQHSLNKEQLVWFRNGSALNTIRAAAS